MSQISIEMVNWVRYSHFNNHKLREHFLQTTTLDHLQKKENWQNEFGLPVKNQILLLGVEMCSQF